MPILSNPATRYDPAPLVDLSGKDERERLSPTAVEAFLSVTERWKVRDEGCRPAPRHEQRSRLRGEEGPGTETPSIDVASSE